MTRRVDIASIIGVGGVTGWLVLVIVLAVPLGFAAFGGWLVADGMRFASNAVKVDAIVIDQGRMERDSGDMFRPLFRFEYPDGQPREARTHTADSDFGFAQGAVVPVLFNPDHPDQVRPHGFWLQYGFGTVFVALGLFVFTVFAVGLGSIAAQSTNSEHAP
jgi:hypothetical protein